MLLQSIHVDNKLNLLATGGATHYPFDSRKKPSAIDFAVYSGIPSDRIRTHSMVDLQSDHLSIVIELAVNGLFKNRAQNPRLLPPRANIKKFQRILSDSIHLKTN